MEKKKSPQCLLNEIPIEKRRKKKEKRKVAKESCISNLLEGMENQDILSSSIQNNLLNV